MTRWMLAAVCIVGVQWAAQNSTNGQEWTRFRGPNGAGVSRATTVPAKWTEKDFNWRVKLPGIGHSSPVIWGQKIFLTASPETTGQRIVFCLHTNDGRLLWSRESPAKTYRKHSLNSFASSTPVLDKDRLYCCWATPDELTVQALDHNGKPLWKTDLGPYKSSYGFGVSPILHAGTVIVGNEHQGQSSLMALDCETGEIHWKTDRNTKVTYITPCVSKRKGRPAELIFTNWKHGITAIDPRNGKTNWEISVFDQKHIETAISSPIVAGDLIYGTCGWMGYATHTVAVRPDDAKPGKVHEVFRVDRGAPLTATPLVKDNLLFLWTDTGIVTCVDATKGELFWRKRVGGSYYGSPVAVGDFVYCLSTAGEAIVLAASKEYQLVARNPLGEASHSTPSVANGAMFLRTFSHLISLGGRR